MMWGSLVVKNYLLTTLLTWNHPLLMINPKNVNTHLTQGFSCQRVCTRGYYAEVWILIGAMYYEREPLM